MPISELIRELRGDLSLNQLHHKTGLSTGYLHRIESGDLIPGDKNLGVLAAGLEAELETLTHERDRTLARKKFSEAVELLSPEPLSEGEKTDVVDQSVQVVIDRIIELRDHNGDGTQETDPEPTLETAHELGRAASR